MAASEGHTKIVELLLSYGANPNMPGIYECIVDYPLSVAARCGNTKIFNLLMDYGANPGTQGINSSYLIIDAAEGGSTEIVECLLRFFAPNPTQDLVSSILVIAVQGGYTGIVKLLLRYGANPNMPVTYPDGYPHPLSVAAEYGKTEIFNLLMDYVADLDTQGMNSSRLIYKAAGGGSTEIVKRLLLFCDPKSTQDRFSDTLVNAAECGYTEIVNLLQNVSPYHEPQSLKALARAIICTCLVARQSKKLLLKQNIASLPPPKTMKDYIYNPLN